MTTPSELLGLSLLGSARGGRQERTFHASDPATGARLGPPFHTAEPEEVELACRLAHEAAEPFGATLPAERAAFLRALAQGLEAARDAVVARAQSETGLPAARLQGEVGRTCGQLRLFADVVEEGSWVDARIDTADPSRQPLPKPDVRSMRRPLGPVVVFGASNFPLAFSVAGGDTASALAAGNPVIVKAHPLHPGTSELVAQVVVAAVQLQGLPEGTFSLLFDDGFGVARALVQHPLVQAVAFTGSRAGGEALVRLAAARPEPIPVYAEMGSVNPVLVLPGALRARAREVAQGLHASFTLGVGQFCTNPGLVLIEAGAEGDAFVEQLAELTRGTPAGAMLSGKTCSAYGTGLERLRTLGATPLARGRQGEQAASGQAALWQIDAGSALAQPELLQEVFGPSTLVVRYANDAQLEHLVRSLEGSLTATVHAQPEELLAQAPLVSLLSRKAGRLVFNQFPTGVEVNQAMVHGGPFPATSDGRSTSVGSRAIERFSRLIAYQNFPDDALPAELRDANPRGIWRLLDGFRTRELVRSAGR
jgi:alpha-ketoglutaric semialdehyde dehydrogenase